uniref:Uncharacterized protein n=1 Tax=Panagrolaimus superbus TaxID=310955 RepID=A0A914YA41_9BILA
MQCFKNSTDIITVDDGTFQIAAIFGSDFDDYYLLFFGSMNEANFIFYDGTMFSDSNKCLKYSDIDLKLLFEQPFWQYTTCCTSFQPVITAAELPKCTNFNISSTIFNITDNNIVATTASNFVLSENDIIGTGRFSLNYSPFEYEFLYAINLMPCQWSSTNFQYCHYPINGEDKTLWFYVRQEPTIDPLAIAGKLIIRNGQTLMAEGRPFSMQNICQNFTQPLHMREIYGGDILNWTVNVLSQFCCTKFENSNPISSPSTIISSKNITEQKCNGIQTSAIYKTLNINMSAALDVSSFNDTINSINVKNFKIDTSLNQSNFQFCTDEFIYVGLQNCRKISSSMNFSVNNSPLKLTLSTHLLNNGYAEYRPALFNGMIDHGSFVSFDGSLFDMNKQKCSTINHDELSVTSCCTSFNQTISLNSVNHPRCKNFHATSTLYNISDNNSIYVTASANFVISDTDIIAIGDFTQFSAPLYSINGFRFEL